MPTTGFTWAVLVAGSKHWENYRHQADVYHAYQLVKNHGIADTNIIVMHYDDIANNPKNPKPGQVFNKPDGPDVYQGVPKDYTGHDVTPDNFIKVLKGDQDLAQSGSKVLQSGSNDNVFIYFADHGAPDAICFPDDWLYADDLNNALQYMYDNNMYSQLVFYLEACNSGSMFDGILPDNINIYATTAANATESSYSTYWDDTIKNFLADEYSANWLENSDSFNNLAQETLQQQYKIVKQETTDSHVMQYGDIGLSNLSLAQFQGSSLFGDNSEQMAVNSATNSETNESVADTVDSADCPIHVVNRTLESTTNTTEREILMAELDALLMGRQFVAKHVKQFVNRIKQVVGENIADDILTVKQPLSLKNKSCYHKLVDTFHHKCLNISQHTYVLRKLYILVNICETLGNRPDADQRVNQIVNYMSDYCEQQLPDGYDRDII